MESGKKPAKPPNPILLYTVYHKPKASKTWEAQFFGTNETAAYAEYHKYKAKGEDARIGVIVID